MKKQNTKKAAQPKKSAVSGQPLDDILINPDTKDMKEAVEKTAVMAFGRFNPPTVGHEKLIKKVAATAKEHNASGHIIASHSQGSAKNPLDQKYKTHLLSKVANPHRVQVHGSSKKEPTFLHAAKKLHAAGHQHLVMVAGSDRAKDYEERLNKYNGHPDHFNFKSIKVVSSGERDPDAEGTKGMSGTKMRELAHSGNHNQFKKGLPKTIQHHASDMIDRIKNIREDRIMDTNMLNEEVESILEAMDVRQRLKRRLIMKRYSKKIARSRAIARQRLAKNPALKRRALKRARQILRVRVAANRGRNYAKLNMSQKVAIDRMLDSKKKIVSKVARRIMPKVKRDEMSRLATVKSGKRFTTSKSSAGTMVAHYELDGPVLSEAELALHIYEDTKQSKELMEAIIPAKAAQSLINKSEKSGIDIDTIAELYVRGLQSWSNLQLENVTPQQHAFGRVNSFIAYSQMDEKKLTPAELKKREEVARAIERDNPDMPMGKKMAIATATAKRVAEAYDGDFDNWSKEEQHIALSDYHNRTSGDHRKKSKKWDKDSIQYRMHDDAASAHHNAAWAHDRAAMAHGKDSPYKHGMSIDAHKASRHASNQSNEVFFESASPDERKAQLKKAAEKLQKGMENTYGKSTVRGLQKSNREVLGVKEKDKPPFKGPYRKAGEVRKDQYGNVIKNVARHLARKAAASMKEEQQIDEISQDLARKYRSKVVDKYTTVNKADNGKEISRETRYGKDFNKRIKGKRLANDIINDRNKKSDKYKVGDRVRFTAKSVSKDYVTTGKIQHVHGDGHYNIDVNGFGRPNSWPHYIHRSKIHGMAESVLSEKVLNEISKRLKGHYIARAALDVSNKSDEVGSERAKGNYDKSNKLNKKVAKRLKNIAKVSYDMQREEQGTNMTKKLQNVMEGFANRVQGSYVPVGQHSFTYHIKDHGRYIVASAKSREKDGVTVKAVQHDDHTATIDAPAHIHNSLVHSFRALGHDGHVTDKAFKESYDFDNEQEINEILGFLARVDEAVGSAAKYADKKGMFGGKYTHHDRAVTMKGNKFDAWRKKQAAKRAAEHQAQDPKMAKRGYAQNIVDTGKAQSKAKKKGLGKQDISWQQKNSAHTSDRPRKLPEAEEITHKGKPYVSGNYGTGSAGQNPPVYKGKKYQSGDAAKNPSPYKGKPYKSGDAGKTF